MACRRPYQAGANRGSRMSSKWYSSGTVVSDGKSRVKAAHVERKRRVVGAGSRNAPGVAASSKKEDGCYVSSKPQSNQVFVHPSLIRKMRDKNNKTTRASDRQPRRSGQRGKREEEIRS